jgi:2-polyprenyl-3-methyl-5-hydroxy-6-metoxy-1,4-benzoquinol methylase
VTPRLPGTAGYAEIADELFRRQGALTFADKHAPTLHLMPPPPARVLDVGCGGGHDAAHLAGQGHDVVAIEPTAELLALARRHHPDRRIAWREDGLPALRSLGAQAGSFDLVLLSAVWMHLDGAERPPAMAAVAQMAAPGATVVLTLRHGPVPAGRRMYPVGAEETVALAAINGLEALLVQQTPSVQPSNRQAGVTWTHLAFRKGA